MTPSTLRPPFVEMTDGTPIYAGLSHGMGTIDADRINADLLTLIQG
jgi:hypothetical protein